MHLLCDMTKGRSVLITWHTLNQNSGLHPQSLCCSSISCCGHCDSVVNQAVILMFLRNRHDCGFLCNLAAEDAVSLVPGDCDRNLSFCQLQVSMSEHWEDSPDLFYKIALVIVT